MELAPGDSEPTVVWTCEDDWPGWRFEGGVWVEGDEFAWVRPSVEVRFEVDLEEATVTVDYPPSSPVSST